MQAVEIVSLTSDQTRTASRNLCEGAIHGATPISHTLQKGDSLLLPKCGAYHIMVLMSGEVVFRTAGHDYAWAERVTFVPDLLEDLSVFAETDAQLLEIRWEMKESDSVLIEEYKTVFPYQMSYALSKQYWDKNKSDKTISRVMLEQRIIPRFAMGSVESYGPDYVKSHDHPMLDQFFVSFPENDMFLLIDYEPYRMRGNEITHIPLGSNHGVHVTEKKHMHYMWIDFLIDDTSMTRLDTSHIPTGKMRDFTNEEKGLV
ncbi:MAG: hypothetical protein ACOX7B_11420 [Christensenellales bacterium]|jgi:hypothetical protein